MKRGAFLYPPLPPGLRGRRDFFLKRQFFTISRNFSRRRPTNR